MNYLLIYSLNFLLTHLFFKDTKLKFQLNEAKMRQYAKEVSTADSDSKDDPSAQSSPNKPETNDDNTTNSNNNNNISAAAMPKVLTHFLTLIYSLTHSLTHSLISYSYDQRGQ